MVDGISIGRDITAMGDSVDTGPQEGVAIKSQRLSQQAAGIGSGLLGRESSGAPPPSFSPLDISYFHASPAYAAVENELLQAYQQGQLFPAQEAAINLATQAGKEEIAQTMAGLGLSQSTMHAMLDGQIDLQAAGMKVQFLNQNLAQALAIHSSQTVPLELQMGYSLGLISQGLSAYGVSTQALGVASNALQAVAATQVAEQQMFLQTIQTVFSTIGSVLGSVLPKVIGAGA